jgi:hypothetical protein
MRNYLLTTVKVQIDLLLIKTENCSALTWTYIVIAWCYLATWHLAKKEDSSQLELISDPALVTFSVRYVFKNILPMTTIYIYRCSGCWRWSHFTIRRTYTCAKSGLSALKLVSFYYARLHDRYYKLPISLVSKVGSPFILLVLVVLAWLTAMAPNIVW